MVLGFPDCDNDDPIQDENEFMKVPCMPFAMSVSCDQSAHCSSGGVRGDLTSSQWARSTSLPPTPPTPTPAPLRPAPTLTSEGESLLDYARTRPHRRTLAGSVCSGALESLLTILLL